MIWIAALLLGVTLQAEARSTLSARFAHGAIAGPGLNQQAVLFLHYFPGDGEAVVGTAIHSLGSVRLKGAQAALGQVELGASSIEIDYLANPLAGEHIDTLYVDLVSDEVEPISWSIAVYSSLDPEGAVAHQVDLVLDVSAPPSLSWSITPEQVYQGERFELHTILSYDVLAGPKIEEVNWFWPPELSWQEGEAPETWEGGLVPGQADTLSWEVRALGSQLGPISFAATARATGQSPAPMQEQRLQVDPLPVVALEAGMMAVGERGQITCTWRNESANPIRLEALSLEINQTFSDVALVESVSGISLIQEEKDKGRSILVDGLESLEAGQEIEVVFEALPKRPGPFTWQSACKPVGRDKFIPLHGANTVNVIWGKIDKAEEAAERVPTDLQLVNRAFAQAIERQVDALPLSPGTRLFLQAEDEKNEANWVVEDALIEALQKRGYRVLVRQAEDREADIVYYRLVRARAVYSPGSRGFLLWGKNLRREVYGDLFLRVETAVDRIIRWDRRIQAYDSDAVPNGGAELLGGGGMVEQTIIKPENKAIERSLSTGIIGGLLYVFFVL